jgi:hypothetical protein
MRSSLKLERDARDALFASLRIPTIIFRKQRTTRRKPISLQTKHCEPVTSESLTPPSLLVDVSSSRFSVVILDLVLHRLASQFATPDDEYIGQMKVTLPDHAWVELSSLGFGKRSQTLVVRSNTFSPPQPSSSPFFME